MRLTDMADELYTAAADLPGGVRAATAKRGGVTVTRVEIAREGLEKPRGRYVTLEVPSVSVLDERDAEDRKSTRLNSSHANESRMPSSA